ncbi:zincin-like metallopeptidase domain-containing protein [Paracoccus onubensis]|uniref:ArdC family protein n=1 Tax=Paracoccus onubensis TaxID=1675788 RepID=UPI002731DD1E|nr:zincin-like metallopeptidase domain-containing protein [Paracoccus onubensis]MDP0930048.1 zincin-like metallopeptidase domain-containing protein [Paracoccus onubensis]
MARNFDIKQHVTDTIIVQIEAGTPPWRKPWTGDLSGASFPLRHNGETYNGINILMLWATAHQRGYNSARWMTFRQAVELGGSVRKGEKAAKSVFYGQIEREDEEAEDGEEGKRRIRFARVNNVFNADQIDGLPEEYYIRPEPSRDLGTQADPELEAFFARTGAEIITSEEPRAYYHPVKDHIHIPPITSFFNAAGYYGTLAHELTHWACGPARLATQKVHASRKEYAFDELVAEIGACFLVVQLGVESQFDQSAAYVEGWLEAMKADKEMIFKAAAEAQKAVDFINQTVGEIDKPGQDAA